MAQVDGIVNRMKREMDTAPAIVATGGLAPLIANKSETIDHADKHLTLKGLYKLYYSSNRRRIKSVTEKGMNT